MKSHLTVKVDPNVGEYGPWWSRDFLTLAPIRTNFEINQITGCRRASEWKPYDKYCGCKERFEKIRQCAILFCQRSNNLPFRRSKPEIFRCKIKKFSFSANVQKTFRFVVRNLFETYFETRNISLQNRKIFSFF